MTDLPTSNETIEFYRFDGREFQPDDLVIEPLPGGDWHEELDHAGFYQQGILHDSQLENISEFLPTAIYLWRAKTAGGPRFALIEIWIAGGLLISVTCTNAWQVLLFLRDYCLPFLHRNDAETVSRFYRRGHEVLFDQDYGLACAQRVAGRERYALELRKSQGAK